MSKITKIQCNRKYLIMGISCMVRSWGLDDPPYYSNFCVGLFLQFFGLSVGLCFYVVFLNVFVFLIYPCSVGKTRLYSNL